MKKIIISVCLMLFACNGFAQQEAEIKKLLATQSAAWNNGDLEEFMQGYWNSDSLLFVGSGGPKYGWQNTLENYRKSYPDKAAMGFLTFDIKSVRMITENDAFVLGAWHLKREKDEPGGFFTLLFRKVNGIWQIVADHSS